MIRYSFKKSFDKLIRKLPLKQKGRIKKICVEIIDVLEGNAELRRG